MEDIIEGKAMAVMVMVMAMAMLVHQIRIQSCMLRLLFLVLLKMGWLSYDNYQWLVI